MNKRDIIIEEARKLFNSYGYKKVSMDELAKQANVTKKTIYSYFKDKEELFKYFIEEELLDIKNKIEKQKKKGSFIDNLSNSIIVMLKVRKESGIVRNLIKDKNDLQNISFLNYTISFYQFGFCQFSPVNFCILETSDCLIG